MNDGGPTTRSLRHLPSPWLTTDEASKLRPVDSGDFVGSVFDGMDAWKKNTSSCDIWVGLVVETEIMNKIALQDSEF